MKILIVTYTYPPAKSVNGFRPLYFARAMEQYGWKVEVLTRHFTGSESFDEYNRPNHTPYSYTLESGVMVHRVPHHNSWFGYYNWPGMRSLGLWKLIYFTQLLCGRTTQESYSKWIGYYLKHLLKSTPYDAILVESGPTNLVRAVARIASTLRIPYIIDFRDAYYHEMYLKDPSKIGFSKKIKLGLEKYYMRRPITSAHYCISLSSTLLNILQVPPGKQKVIVNGYDEVAWSKLKNNPDADIFSIIIAGTLYDREILKIFLEGLQLFLSKGLKKVEVLFIAPGPPSVIERIREALPFDDVKILPTRISYEATLEHMATAQVLAYHGWKGYSGYPSAKIYEYIRSGKKIWILPADGDVIDALLLETQTGKSFTDPGIAAQQLHAWYDEWVIKGEVTNTPNWEIIQRHSRQVQSEKINQIVSAMTQGLK
ncbi:MAG: hypothetical protein IPI77_20265 [Saprospiraceae bacterium]|nr:hypothetical protein [Saprospiraceae bacterium]